jgi:uncharacterized protein (TIGR03067 family)
MNGPVCLGAMLLSVLLSALLSVSTPALAAEAEPAGEPAKRTWRARNGQFKVEAVLVDFDDESVRLRRDDGKLLSVELKKLSRSDRKYIDDRRAAQAKQADAKDKPADAKAVRDTTVADKKALQGLWQMIYIERDGVAIDLPASVLSQFRLDFSGDTMTGYLSDQKFKVDGSGDPKQIVLVRVKPDKISRPIHAIYSFDGDLLKICRSMQPGGARPKKMETNKDDGNELTAFKRIARK